MELLNKIFLCHFAVIGHIFPIWLKFNGGKGVATYIGFLFGINIFLGLYFLIAWFLIAAISKYSSLGSKKNQGQSGFPRGPPPQY